MQPFPRRRFLELTLVSAGALLGPTACSSAESAPDLDSARVFPQSLASGDPRATSVVLWTRVVDSEHPNSDLQVSLELALNADFTQRVSLDGAQSRKLLASAAFDHCVKTRVEGLTPGTEYYYRFSYERDGARATTRIGRTKTAPSEGADVSVRFAVVSCQDYAGKYFHAYRMLATLDLDVVVHLGDYVYETTADPSFQVADAARKVSFGKPEQALSLGSGNGAYQAAQSLDNYRDLYRLYRTDPDLQAVHERFAMIAIQDDHEFSDDCHGAVSAYEDGRVDETNLERRLAADQAWFEYMPADLSQAPTRDWDASQPFPDQLSYYRSFLFGRHLELVMTDLRRYRPDHLVPEDAFPGAVFLEQPELLDISGGELPPDAVAYVDIGSYAGGVYQRALSAGAEQLGFQESSIRGLLSVPFINGALDALALSRPAAIVPEESELARGYAYHQLLKSDEFSRIGSRYVLALKPFEALAKARFRDTKGQSERLMGETQRAWFLDTMKASTRTFKIWGSEVCLMSRHIDLTPVTLAPETLRQKIAISAEDWDGFPNERAALLGELSQLDNVVIVSGDLHCFFAGTPYSNDDPQQRVVEFVTGSLSSTTWLDGLSALAEENPSLPPETKFIAASIPSLLVDPDTRPNPHLAWQNLADNGFAVFEANGERLSAKLLSLSSAAVATAPGELGVDLSSLFSEQNFEVRAGSADLFRERDGVRERWDIETMTWVGVG
ncbi:MAG TPA: alkaline phosphatase D family protein [Polyangiaceae bacterium]|nr:alkaline phosphatase D family protein [Polyangiaceae bacterium]